MSNKNLLIDFRKWLLTQTTITALTTASNIWKYFCRMVSELPFGKSGQIALIIELLPNAEDNQFSSQQNTILQVKGYAGDSYTNGQKTADDSEDRCWNFYYIFDEVINRKSREILSLDNFTVLGISRIGSPNIQYDELHECNYIVANYDVSYLLK